MSAIGNLRDEIRQAQATQRLQLPSLPEVVLAIRDAIHDERKGVAHIARLLQLDPILSARVLKIANSPLYHCGVVINDIKQAVTRLGLATTRNLVTCLVMHNLFDVQTVMLRQRIQALWQHSSQVAAIAQNLARSQRGLSPDKALLAGLLHDIGVLPILVYADQLRDSPLDPQILDDVIADLRGEIGSAVLANWQMDTDIVQIPLLAENYLRDHAGPADYTDLVVVAQVHSLFGTQPRQPVPALVQLPAFAKLSIAQLGPDASIEVMTQAKTEIAATVRMLQNG